MKSSKDFFEKGLILNELPSLKEHLREVNALLGSLLGINSNDEHFFEKVHHKLVIKFQNRDNYLGFLKAFANSPIVQSIPSNNSLLSSLELCGVKVPSLVTPPLLHVVAEDLIINSEKVFTPPHQDVVSTKGAVGQVVVWIPLHDIGTESYGIGVIPGSHKLGVLETEDSGFGHTVKSCLISDLSKEYIESNSDQPCYFLNIWFTKPTLKVSLEWQSALD